jgi:hypothetical protein
MQAWMHHPQGELAEALHGIGFYSTVDEPWPPAQPALQDEARRVVQAMTAEDGVRTAVDRLLGG